MNEYLGKTGIVNLVGKFYEDMRVDELFKQDGILYARMLDEDGDMMTECPLSDIKF